MLKTLMFHWCSLSRSIVSSLYHLHYVISSVIVLLGKKNKSFMLMFLSNKTWPVLLPLVPQIIIVCKGNGVKV